MKYLVLFCFFLITATAHSMGKKRPTPEESTRPLELPTISTSDFGGSGCPGGLNTRAELNEQGLLLVTIDLRANAAAGSFDRQACSLITNLMIPAGKRAVAKLLDLSGSAKPNGKNSATLFAELFFVGGHNNGFIKKFKSSDSGNFHEDASRQKTIRSVCAQETAGLRLNTSIVANDGAQLALNQARVALHLENCPTATARH